MKCPYCNNKMVEWENANIAHCNNDECPHKDLDWQLRKGAGTREYCCLKFAITSDEVPTIMGGGCPEYQRNAVQARRGEKDE